LIDRLLAVRRMLTRADAEGVPERLVDGLTEKYGLQDIELYLVDYRLAALLPLLGGEPVTFPGDAAWRSFDHQTEVIEETDLYLPITARGERIGVLRCAPAPDDPDVRGELAEIATVIGHELQSAAAGTDRYRMASRTRRLTLAAEVQWGLLPARSRIRPAFSLAGQLEPSYAVNGDSFDWAEHDGRLYVSVIGGMGEGVQAAMLTSLATYALRNARRAGLDLAGQAVLADQAVFAAYRGAVHVAVLLLELDLASGQMLVIDAGSPRTLLMRDGAVHPVRLEAQFPLGMFEDSEYAPESLTLHTADRLVFVSDGVFEAVGATGRYGDTALERFIRATGSMAPLQVVRSLLGNLRTYVGDSDLDNDAVAVCLDWAG
jgi:serine phosphatase RsbU (regulator of sigma subunit)